jgi:hypothetical protein
LCFKIYAQESTLGLHETGLKDAYGSFFNQKVGEENFESVLPLAIDKAELTKGFYLIKASIDNSTETIRIFVE